MGKIYMPNEDTRPRIICGHCKTEQIVDIRAFNTDITRLAEYTCSNCRKKIYAGVLLLAHTHLNGLLQNIQTVIDAVGTKNTLLVDNKGNNTSN